MDLVALKIEKHDYLRTRSVSKVTTMLALLLVKVKIKQHFGV